MSRSRDRAKAIKRREWVRQYLERIGHHQTPEPADRGEDAEIAGSG